MSESPEIGESGRGAGVEFQPVAGESRCAGVHVFYLNLRPSAHAAVSFNPGLLRDSQGHSLLRLIQLVKGSFRYCFIELNKTVPKHEPLDHFDCAQLRTAPLSHSSEM